MYFNVALLILSCLGYLKFIAKKLRLGFGAAPFIYCCFVALLLYFFGIGDLLPWGYRLATAIGLGLLAGGVAGSRQRFFDFAQPVSLAFVLLSLLGWFYWAIDGDFRFLLWDEFSFWAASTKLIYTTDSLFKENSPIFLKSYPPIQQLFQYYVLQFFSWSEKTALFAQDIWLLSGVLCIASLARAGAMTKIALFFLVATLMYAFGYSFSSLYSDALLGMCFVAALSFAVKEDQSAATWAALALSVGVLLLLKEIGILLALVACFVYATNLLLANRSQRQSLGDVRVAFSGRLRSNLLKIVSIFICMFVVMQSWAWYVRSIGASRALAIPTLAEWRDEPHQRRLLTTLGEFMHRMTETAYHTISIPFTPWHPTLLMIVATLSLLSLLVFYRARPGQRLFCGITIGALFVGFWGYAAALLLSYLIIFTEYEGIRLASFERYLSTYLLPWASFVFVMLFDSSDSWVRKKNTLIAVICLTVLTAMTHGQFLTELGGIKSAGPDKALRQQIESFADQVKQHILPSDKVYFIAQRSNGLERVMFYYAMLPNTISMSWCWSLGQKYDEGDVWTCNQALEGLLKGFDYLALYRGDEQFWDNNQAIFDPTSVGAASGLYKIDRHDGQTLLTKVSD